MDETGTPAPVEQRRRHLGLAGTRNLRDIGGYRTRDGRQTRWGTVYRSDCLDRLTPESRRELIALGIRTIIDLRDNEEVAARANVLPDSATVRYRRLPVWDEPPPKDVVLPLLTEGYARTLEHGGGQFVGIVRALLEPGALPALVHCASGKDRTGVAAALLLSAVGVGTEDVAADYALSGACLGEAYLEEVGWQWLARSGHSWEQYRYLFTTPPERMLATLDHLRQRWGSAEGYLVAHGLGADEIDELRERLVESRRSMKAEPALDEG
jgi:protein-tyrosine phosphatase